MSETSETFRGFVRSNDAVGVRNHLLVLSSTLYANAVCERIASTVRGSVALVHPLGRAQVKPDLRMTFRTLVGHGSNPNAAAVLVVDHYQEQGCSAEEIAHEIAKTGKRVEIVNIRASGGVIAATANGTRAALSMAREMSDAHREPVPMEQLFLGMNCGTSDTTSGPGANSALGVASDRLIAQGGRSVFAELPELMGAEPVLRQLADSTATGDELVAAIAAMEQRALDSGEDIRGSQPTGDNILGGLSTIEEKSLGGVLKAGKGPIVGVIDYAEEPGCRAGVYLMVTPGHGGESITGIAGGGSQLLVFTTGGGHAIAHPLMPTIKVTANSESYQAMSDTVELDVSGVLRGEMSMDEAGDRVYEEIQAVASGRLTLCEVLREETGFAIHRVGMSL